MTVLRGWGEIATRLGVSVRTGQRLARDRGLPVCKDGDRQQSPVWAYAEEIDAWVDAQRGTQPNRGVIAVQWAQDHVVVLAVAASLVVGASLLAWLSRTTPAPQSSIVIDDTLITYDASGTELWRYQFPFDLSERSYRDAQYEPQILDIDGDGTLEVLFITVPTASDRAHDLRCFSNDGIERWRFRPGQVVSTAAEVFDDVYVIAHARVSQLGPSSDRSVVVVSHHFSYYPTQITVLSASGQNEAEYWHAGHVGVGANQLQVGDLNQDGWMEIYAAGTSNARDRATLVVLDPRTMIGAASEPRSEYQLRGMPPAVEIARLVFPRSAVSIAGGDRYNVAESVSLGPGGLTVGVLERLGGGGESLHYRLAPDLAVESVIETDSYLAAVREARRTDTSFARGEPERLAALVEALHTPAPSSQNHETGDRERL